MDTDRLFPGGAADIGYNAAACQHGFVFEGRGQGLRSAANGTDRGNGSSYAVVFLGGEAATFTEEAKRAIIDAANWLGGEIKFGHRDHIGTGCPGDEIYRWVQQGGDDMFSDDDRREVAHLRSEVNHLTNIMEEFKRAFRTDSQEAVDLYDPIRGRLAQSIDS